MFFTVHKTNAWISKTIIIKSIISKLKVSAHQKNYCIFAPTNKKIFILQIWWKIGLLISTLSMTIFLQMLKNKLNVTERVKIRFVRDTYWTKSLRNLLIRFRKASDSFLCLWRKKAGTTIHNVKKNPVFLHF